MFLRSIAASGKLAQPPRLCTSLTICPQSAHLEKRGQRLIPHHGEPVRGLWAGGPGPVIISTQDEGGPDPSLLEIGDGSGDGGPPLTSQ